MVVHRKAGQAPAPGTHEGPLVANVPAKEPTKPRISRLRCGIRELRTRNWHEDWFD